MSKLRYALLCAPCVFLMACMPPVTINKNVAVQKVETAYNKDLFMTGNKGLVVVNYKSSVEQINGMDFSADISGDKQNSSLFFSGKNKIAVLQLPPGEYAISKFYLSAGNSYMNFGDRFTMKFQSVPGQITYIGEINLLGAKAPKTGKNAFSRWLEQDNRFMILAVVNDNSSAAAPVIDKLKQDTGAQAQTVLGVITDGRLSKKPAAGQGE